MHKADLIQKVADEFDGDTKLAARALNAVTAAIEDAVVNGEKVTVTGFGTFMPVGRKAREARNPINGETIQVPAKTAITFRAGSQLRERVNGGEQLGF